MAAEYRFTLSRRLVLVGSIALAALLVLFFVLGIVLGRQLADPGLVPVQMNLPAEPAVKPPAPPTGLPLLKPGAPAIPAAPGPK